jgi:hypothetical protein
MAKHVAYPNSMCLHCNELDLTANYVFEGGYDIDGHPMK